MLNIGSLLGRQAQQVARAVARRQKPKGNAGQIAGVAAAKRLQARNRAAILDVIRQNTGARPLAIATATGLCLECVRLHLVALAAAGRIRNAGTKFRPVWVAR